jgi:hypothetical protein
MNDQDKNSKSKNPLEEIDITALQQMPLTVELAGKIVNAIQIGIYGETAWNRKNYSSEPQRIKKSNGQYLITDIVYAHDYSNSLLDISLPFHRYYGKKTDNYLSSWRRFLWRQQIGRRSPGCG